MAFVELCARSNFSFLEGASHPEEYVAAAGAAGHGAIGLLDRDGIYGLVRAYREAKERGVALKSGAELTLARPVEGAPRSVLLFVEDHRGYQSLCELLTRAHAPYEKGTCRLALSDLAEGAAGLSLALPTDLACYARGARRVRDWGPEWRAALAAFRGRSYVAAHRAKDGFDAQRADLAEWLAEEIGAEGARAPIFATARPLFHTESRRVLADVVTCIREKLTLDGAGTRLASNAEARLRSERSMLALFRDHPDWVHASGELAERLTFSFAELRYRFPCDAHCEPGETPDGALRRLTERGLSERYGGRAPERVTAQCDKELALIERLAVAPYFLSVYEVVQMARRRRILCQGRGSAANSAVCYALSITAVDPARSNLLFERFLSAERAEPPDIDVDFEHERREEVIQEIYATYGRDRAAMVSEVISYRGRSALREVGKVFGLATEQLDRLTNLVLRYDLSDVSEALVREVGLDPRDARLSKAIHVAHMMEGAPRHLGVHVGGFILSAEPLSRVAPVEPARMEGRTVIPWDKDDVDTLGFFKMDVLGLGMLTCVRKSLALIHELGLDSAIRPSTDTPFDPLEAVARIPAEDEATYDAICAADTVGVFQIESRAQMSMLPRLRPRCFYDLVIEVAIVRPGPIQGGMVHPYLRRRTGEEPARAPHPCLEEILARTLGVPLFQEQVMQISMVGAGYGAGEADQLRRDMAAWKRHGRLERHREKLLRGFAERGITPEFGEALFKQIQGFGEYGFPESHAASFALIVYASAWLKTHHPGVFACALLNAQPMGFYSPSSIVQDAQRHGVEVRPPRVAVSRWDNTLEPSVASYDELALRLGLRQIAGVGEESARRIEAAREVAPYSSVGDLARRASLNKKELVALAEAGALEGLEVGRRQAMWRAHAPRLEGLFEAIDLESSADAPNLPPLRKVDELLLDYGSIGLSIDDHPMKHVRPQLSRALGRERLFRSEQLRGLPHGAHVTIAGLVTGRQRPQTASGVTFVSLEDETGLSNLILTVPVFERHRHAVLFSKIALVRGVLERSTTPLPTSERLALRRRPPVDVLHVKVHAFERIELESSLPAELGEKVGDLPHKSRDFH